MKPSLRLTWTLWEGGECRGGNLPQPEWINVEAFLEPLRACRGSLSLDPQEPAELGPQICQVIADQGKFILMLGELDESDYNVRSFSNPDAGGEWQTVGGNRWSEGLICRDFAVVVRVFQEFFTTGNVSRSLLD